MGNCAKQNGIKSIDRNKRAEILQNSDCLNENDNLITNEDALKTSQNSTIFETKVEKKNNIYIKYLKEISSDVKSLKKKENIERNNQFFSTFPINSGDFILERMKSEWIEKEKKKFKNQIKSEIKGNLISPEIKNLKNEIEKINEINSNNNIKIELEFKKEIDNLKKYFEVEKEKAQNENNKKIENLTKQNENSINSLKNEYDNKIDDLKKIFDSEIYNLINQININKTNFEKYKNEAQSEILNLKEQIQKEKTEKEVLIKQIDKKFKNNENEFNNKLKANKEENNIKFEKVQNKVKEIEILKNQIENLSKEQMDLKDQNEEKNKELINLDKKINIKEEKIKNLDRQTKNINDTLKQKTKKLINESFIDFSDNLKKLYQINKHKKQQEVKNKLFLGKNYAKVGLNNIGNNCYINSVLQILKNIPKFTYNFYKLQDNNDTFLCSLKDLLINLCKSNMSSFPPNEFKKNLGLENKKFAGNNQYDSTIFYVSLLNIIAKKLNKPININIRNIEMNKCKNKSIKEQFAMYKTHYLLKHPSFIYEFFYLFYSNKTFCKSCDYSKELFQAANYLDFPIVSDNGPVRTLEECFKNFQENKEIDSECSQCNSKKLNQNFTIYELPPVLMINLKRVGENSAYFNEVEIPFQLDINKIIDKIKMNSIYELRGFIKHDGNENSGHNYSYCKNMFDDKWYKYSDSICTPIDGEPKLDKIFFLCYIKIGNDINNVEYLKEII